MCIKQRVEFGKALRRRRKRRASRAADVTDLLRTEKLDGGEPRHRLLGGNGEARAAQQPDEAEEVDDRLRRVVHACASARMASIRGAI